MRAELRNLLLAGAACVALTSNAIADDGENPKDSKPGDVSQCVKVRTEALYVAYGYDHHVHVTNGCDKAVRCAVTTSANPDPTTVSLASGEHRDIVMFRGSPASVVNAQVKCKAADAT